MTSKLQNKITETTLKIIELNNTKESERSENHEEQIIDTVHKLNLCKELDNYGRTNVSSFEINADIKDIFKSGTGNIVSYHEGADRKVHSTKDIRALSDVFKCFALDYNISKVTVVEDEENSVLEITVDYGQLKFSRSQVLINGIRSLGYNIDPDINIPELEEILVKTDVTVVEDKNINLIIVDMLCELLKEFRNSKGIEDDIKEYMRLGNKLANNFDKFGFNMYPYAVEKSFDEQVHEINEFFSAVLNAHKGGK